MYIYKCVCICVCVCVCVCVCGVCVCERVWVCCNKNAHVDLDLGAWCCTLTIAGINELKIAQPAKEEAKPCM